MREKTSKTAIFLLSLSLLAPLAVAHSLKPARPAVPAKPMRAAHPKQDVNVSARSGPGAASKVRYAAKPAPPSRVSQRRYETSRWVVPRATRRIEERDLARSRAGDPRPKPGRALAAVKEPRVERRPEAPAPLAAAVALPPIEVHHNRKIHYTPESAAPAGDSTEPSGNSAMPLPAPGTTPAADTPAPSAALKQPVSATKTVVERKLPTFSPAAVLVPDPVIDPVLYTARGHLIVPPAMKGSTEILRHQNEMADRDGLIRVQDDDDLSRLRESKQLVALPAGPALEVDERLPANRRYCRPWTAQFLTALARAHYARFHAPLQVNSAVRTVEFQERLRFTNGNAAPAGGETASPHLTGQAVDLAKHGLSMTEIAWLRGYLMPLVQQGKVDVEEEFQQSCFHISVYKKYLPQPTPKRDIQSGRSPVTALAAAIR